MGFLKHFRLRNRLEVEDKHQLELFGSDGLPIHGSRRVQGTSGPRKHSVGPPDASTRHDFTAGLPSKTLRCIFAYVCPHTADNSFEPSEKADVGDGCMLCDLRDLAACAKVRRRWYHAAQEQLYSSIRIDPVHYCDLEYIRAEQRRRKSSFRNHRPEDIPLHRLRQLADTLRASAWLAAQVRFLKLPYMTREAAKADLARAVSGCPNIEYVDLPEGFYTGDATCNTLRQELYMHCPNIKTMRYMAGSEQFLQILPQGNWQAIEMLELSKIRVEIATFRFVLASLPALHSLKIYNVHCFTDEVFSLAPSIPDFPPLQTLVVEKCRGLTAAGLIFYLQSTEACEALQVMSLTSTGVLLQEVHSILLAATHLLDLSITQKVDVSLPLEPLQPLASPTLQTLHFEIIPTDEYLATGLPKPSDSHYAYLVSSLLSSSLPALKTLYVRDPDLPNALLLTPPDPAFAHSTAGKGHGRNNSAGAAFGKEHRSSFGGRSLPSARRYSAVTTTPPINPILRAFNQPLEVFTKGLNDSDWIASPLTAPRAFETTTLSRPNSSHHSSPLSPGSPKSPKSVFPNSHARNPSQSTTHLSPEAAFLAPGTNRHHRLSTFSTHSAFASGDARRSVVVGDGVGGFLAVPVPPVPDDFMHFRNFPSQGGGHSRGVSRDRISSKGSKGSKGQSVDMGRPKTSTGVVGRTDGKTGSGEGDTVRRSWWNTDRRDSGSGMVNRASRGDLWR